jgi:CMP-N-acetylneuraminic acid synthetase
MRHLQEEPVICIIPARGGSKRIPLKNRQCVGGLPLWERAMKTALAAGVFSNVLVSSDDPMILEDAGRHALKRPAELATDDATTLSVVMHALEWNGRTLAAVLQCTTPEMQATDIEDAIRVVREYDEFAVCTVNSDGRRNGFYVSYEWHPRMWESYIASQTPADYIDINTPEDLEEVRRRFA